jgi:hypothetical protein
MSDVPVSDVLDSEATASDGGAETLPSGRQFTPLPAVPGSVDRRMLEAWCQWLTAMASDAEAALAAAFAYRDLDANARDTWLGALAQDADRLNVPKAALYAPLLAVESDSRRRRRMLLAAGGDLSEVAPRGEAYALAGWGKRGLRVATLVTPLYLDFVQVLACGYNHQRGFDWVRHDPIVDRRKAPTFNSIIEGVKVEAASLNALIDDLAHAVLAHQRAGRSPPEALRVFSDLFEPRFNSTPV